jgi:hypothetical protein
MCYELCCILPAFEWKNLYVFRDVIHPGCVRFCRHDKRYTATFQGLVETESLGIYSVGTWYEDRVEQRGGIGLATQCLRVIPVLEELGLVGTGYVIEWL